MFTLMPAVRHQIITLAIVFVLLSLMPASAEYYAVPGVIDTRTTFSDGAYTPQELADLAMQKGLRVLVINDHDRVAMEYGLPPLRHILKYRIEHNSINLKGADRYLKAIEEVEKKHPDMIVIPGSETTPFYYWSGSLLSGNLTANNPERRLLTVGLSGTSGYENLPILHNGGKAGSATVLVLLVAAIALSLLMVRRKGMLRVAGILVGLSAVLLADRLLSTDSSPFDPYHGDQGMAPYQLVIDYVTARGGLTFWNYPETKSGIRKLGPIMVNTPPYPRVLTETRGYTGFSALYGDNITITEPGNIWDLTLKEYCSGFRERPPWGIATSDYHREGESGEKLGNYQTVFLLREFTKTDVMDAMRSGRMYASRGNFPHVPKLLEFSVSSPDGGSTAISGQEILLTDKPAVRVSMSLEGKASGPVKVRVIRSGQVIKYVESPLPITLYFQDDFFQPGEKVYYRVDMSGDGAIVSNPIFVRFKTAD